MTSAEFVRSSRINIVTTIGAVLVWPMLVLLWPEIDSQAGLMVPQDGPGHKTRFVVAMPGNGRTAWAPVLIPLPSPAAFSGALRSETSGGDSLAVIRRDSAMMFEMDGIGSAQEPVSSLYSIGRMLGSATRYDPVPVDPPVFSGTNGDGVAGMTVQISPELERRGYRIGNLPAGFWPDRNKTWTAGVLLELGPDGRISHVLLCEPSGDDKINELVVKAFRLGSAQAGSTDSGGRARITWQAGRTVQPKIEKGGP